MAKYKDIDISFSRNSFTGDLNILEDNVSIKQSIKNILLTFLGEKSFRPKFGLGIQKSLFETNSIIISNMANDIIQTLNSYEPRIKVNSVSPTFNSGNLDLEIKYEYYYGGTVLNDTTRVTTNVQTT